MSDLLFICLSSQKVILNRSVCCHSGWVRFFSMRLFDDKQFDRLSRWVRPWLDGLPDDSVWFLPLSLPQSRRETPDDDDR
jgi:hypothetical protein